MSNKLSTSNLVTLVSGAVLFLASFLAFFKFGSASRNAWSGDIHGPFTDTKLVALAGLVAAAHIALTAFSNVDMPDRILSLTWNQVHGVIAGYTLLVMFAWLITDKQGADLGIGGILMFLAAIGLVVGAAMRSREHAPAPAA